MGKKVCSECGTEMLEGFVIDDGWEYYCSEECLHKNYSAEEYAEMYSENYAYWTEWEEEQDYPPDPEENPDDGYKAWLEDRMVWGED